MHHHHYLKALATLGVLIMAQSFVRPQYLCAAKSIASSLADIDLEISKHEDFDPTLYILPPPQHAESDQFGADEHYFYQQQNAENIPKLDTNFAEAEFHQRKSSRSKNHILFNSDDTQKILSRTDRSVDLVTLNNSLSGVKRVKNISGRGSMPLERNERSTNLSHIAGSTRRIQLYIKNRFLQILPDGTVNGTTDDTSDYTIIQRTTVNVGQIKIQAVATCLFLCMDSCGATYGSAHFNDDCVFNEAIEQHHYNTYSSTFHSNDRRKLYLGLNRHGHTRKVILNASRQLGKLSTYTNSLTHPISHYRVNKVLERIFGSNHVGHSLKQLCENSKLVEDILANGMKPKPKCDPNHQSNGTAGSGAKLKQPAKNKKKNPKNSEGVESSVDQISNSNKNFPNGSIIAHNKNRNINNDQNIIKLNNNKKNCNQNPHQKRCQNIAAGMKGDRKNVKNHNNQGKKNNSGKNHKNEKKVVDRKENKPQVNKIRRINKKKLTTTVHSTTVDDDSTTVRSSFAGNYDENFASDEIGSEEDEYEEGGLSVSKSHTLSFVNNNDAYEDNS